MPLSALLALFITTWTGPDQAVWWDRVFPKEWGLDASLATMAALVTLAVTLGRWVSWRVGREGGATLGVRKVFARGAMVLDALVLVGFAAIARGFGWAECAEAWAGGSDRLLLVESLTLAPYFAMQLAVWWGLHAAETALRPLRKAGPLATVVRHARRTFGMVLPPALLFAAGQDALTFLRPDLAHRGDAPLVATALMGLAMLGLAPTLVRLAWPCRPLPAGPLRDRLERLAARCRFRCTEILVWDTGMTVVNAGVTGATPWFRYVVLSDLLVERLDPREAEAVFGHEVGHIAHRHLRDIALFFLLASGPVALAAWGIDRLGLDEVPRQALSAAGLILGIVIGFGAVSRRLERQADLFGARCVSCGRPDCPPHLDPDGDPGVGDGTADLCPVGIRTFANALISVATINGTPRNAGSWRHGSIAQRVAFLEHLEGRSDADRRFQNRLRWQRLGLGLLLVSSLVIAWRVGALDTTGTAAKSSVGRRGPGLEEIRTTRL